MNVCTPTRSILAAAALASVALIGLAAPVSAQTDCTTDTCVVNNDVQTPAGPVTVTVTPNNVVTVHLTIRAARTRRGPNRRP